MANSLEFATESVEGVRFGFMSDEEAKKLSFQKITNPQVLDPVGRPVPGGLYDPALGPMDESTICKTCGQRYFGCPGHFGHIDLVSVVYNPLLFNTLVNILRKTCFFCLHFKSTREEVEICLLKLTLIAKGDIVGSKNVDTTSLYSSMSELSEDGNDKPYSGGGYHNLDEQEMTSLQLKEARSILRDFLKFSLKCQNCGGKGPRLKKPTFGWIHMSGMSDANIRANVIKGCKLGEAVAGGDGDEKSTSEVENDDVLDHGEVGASMGEDTSSVSTPGEAKAAKKKKKLEEPQVEFLEQRKMFKGSMLPSTAREIIRRVWENEAELCSFICNIDQHQMRGKSQSAGYSMFFLKRLPVPPIKFRPPAKQADSVMEHPQTVLLSKILEANVYLGNARERGVEHTAVLSRWMSLQQSINVYFDSKTAVGQSQKSSSMGICQLLEKKEGLFRQKMMGKRVNYACRSVISPDPYLAVNEIGIPPAFALKLTYPERVTPWNVMKLRDAVVNGPLNHPGATNYIDGVTSIRLLEKNARIAIARKLASSRGAVTAPGKSSNYDFEGKVVLRHIRDGDAVLANRQPTLHKPSICGFFVRVLPGEKTIRMHYVNCDSFNADFDGDEINVHFPQDEVSRAEAYNIVNADYQYIVPTRGDPKRALIQDHIVSAVLLTKRDTFLTWDEFNQLLYSSGLSSSGSSRVSLKPGCKVSVIDSEDLVSSLPPAILKPQRLWTGKQVITAILKHITQGEPFTVMKRGKIAREYFGKRVTERKDKQKKPNIWNLTESIDEDVVFVYKNELVQGVIDKEQFGKYGLVHTVQELFGSGAAGTLLSVLSRVLTTFLQLHGFTCGVDDLLLFQDYENQRKQLLEVCQSCGEEVHMQFLGFEGEQIGSADMKVEIEKAIFRNGDAAVTLLDAMMQNKLKFRSSALSELFPRGLIKPFRSNWLSQMTLSGAKGGTANFQQISLLLGQQVLEGKRVPRMVSGKTLPCFPPWDTASRAGGFISDRYLSGLRPQEFYFHCMAGREGLVDTAVKTSRSGYLQRCLIKNMESLKVHYDYTVRDADGSIIQFCYGEDGVDVHKKNFIQEFDSLALVALNRNIVQNRIGGGSDDACGSNFIEDNPYHLELAEKAKDFLMDERTETACGIRQKRERKEFVKLIESKYFMSLAQPGEPVGVIAAQSIGEPSTQMTLNTFHHAGRGEMNVTLGIPRLQEIVMTASSNIRTPTMTCPLRRDRSGDNAEQLASKMRKVCVADLIENTEVCAIPFTVSKNDVYTLYKLQIKLYGPESYPPHTGISLEDCQETLECVFMRQLEDAIERHMQLLSKISGIADFTPEPETGTPNDANDKGTKSERNDAGSDDDAANEEGGDDLGADVMKSKKQVMDDLDYDDVSDNETEGAVETDGSDIEDDQSVKDNDGDNSKQNDSAEGRTEGQSKSSESPEKVKPEAEQKKTKSTREKKTDRAIYVACDGLHLEAHFKFSVDEPHIMLAQIVEKTAKNVAIKSRGSIDQCKLVKCDLDESENSKSGGIPMLRLSIQKEGSRLALQTAGIDFMAFWELQDDLDVNWISTNDVDAILRTYGIEAARATIITEIYRVFHHYGVTVDMRHLMLVADFMTHTGEYRSMNRMGGIADSNSPFARMCFETASKFIVQAATHSEKDYLQTPSARVCLGLPAKVGTGCFDLLHKLDYGSCEA